MATTKTVKYEDQLRKLIAAVRKGKMLSESDFSGFTAGTADEVANLVAATRALATLPDGVEVVEPGERGVFPLYTAERAEAMARLRRALDALDRETR